MTSKIPPLLDLKVSNPVTYIKLWWKKVIENEGVDFRIHFHPLTAIAIALALAGVGFGIGRITMPFNIPFLELNNQVTASPNPTPNDWKETAFTGTLQYSNLTSKYFLITTSASEAISLQAPKNIDLSELVGKRILVIGSYNKTQRLFVITDAKNMEVLPKSPMPVPTTSPTPEPTPSLTPTPESTATPSPSPGY